MARLKRILDVVAGFGFGLYCSAIPNGFLTTYSSRIGGVIIACVAMIYGSVSAPLRNADGTRTNTAALSLLAGWAFVLAGGGVLVFAGSRDGFFTGLLFVGLGLGSTLPIHLRERQL